MDSARSHRIRWIMAAAPLLVGLLLAGCATAATPGPSSPPPSASSGAASPAAPGTSGPGSDQPSAPATEVNPPGDIPDSQVYVPYPLPGAHLQVSVPEGWARSAQRGTVIFSDKLNSVAIQVVAAPAAPTVASTKATEVPSLAKAVTKFAPGDVTVVRRKGGSCVRVTYQQDSAADQVTGKVVRDAVERYEFYQAGREAIITLSGPMKADNVDPWRVVSDSVSWT